MHKGVKEREKMSRSRITQSFKSDKKLIWKSIYSDAKIRSGNSPAQIPRKLNRRWIIIQPLNVGDKGVAKIKWRHALGTKESGMSHKKINTCCCDLTNETRSWGRSDERIKILLFFRGAEKQDFEGLLWGPIVPCAYTALEETRPNI